jgi:chromosome segregation ATPase
MKKLTELAFKTQNIELQEGILSLREKLAEAKEALLNAKEEITAYKEENAEIKQKIKTLEKELETLKNPEYKVIFKKGLYYKENGEGGYCTGCYDNNKKLINVIELPGGLDMKRCPVCKAVYK